MATSNDDESFMLSMAFCGSLFKTLVGILLLIPVLWWLFGEFFGWWNVDLYDWDYVLVGLSAIAGAYLVANGGFAALVTIVKNFYNCDNVRSNTYTIKVKNDSDPLVIKHEEKETE